MKISLVPPEHINSVWWAAINVLDRAVKRAKGRYATADILAECRDGKAQLWIAFDDDLAITTAATTKILQYPRTRSLLIEFLAGDGFWQCKDEALEILTRYGKEMGCTKMEILGREGWQRALASDGFKATQIFCEREI